MKVTVDPGLCEGNALCVAVAPQMFRLKDDDEHAVVLDEHPAESARAAVRRAVTACPRQAISLLED